MDKSPLGRLPPELRLYIYELTFTPSSSVKIKADFAKSPEMSSTDRLVIDEDAASCLAITQTCKQIETECLPVFYACNELVIRAEAAPLRRGSLFSHEYEPVTLRRALDKILEVGPSKLNITADIGAFHLTDVANSRCALAKLLKACSENMKLRLSGPCRIKFVISSYAVSPSGIEYDKPLKFMVDCRDMVTSGKTIQDTLQAEISGHPDSGCKNLLLKASRLFQALQR